MDLFGGQDVLAAPVQPPEEAWGAVGVQWLRPRVGRQLCDHCTQIIHRNKGGASPRVATARRKGPNGELQLCSEHAQLQRELDDNAEATRRERLAQQGKTAGGPRKAGRHREHA